MKTNITKVFAIGALLVAMATKAQAPNLMSYQAVIRNSANTLVANQPVGVQVSILQTSATGTAVYKEVLSGTTNTNGLLTLQIGSGTAISGSFSGIDWSAGPYFIKTETDATGGTNYTITATSQLMSVPYALYAKTAGSGGGSSANAWGLAGNAGTTSANFIGTTDDNVLQLKVNNKKAGVIEDDDANYGNTIKNANTAYGFQSLNANTTGNGNTANG